MVMDSGFHYCDGMRHLLGEVESVYAETREVISGAPRPLSEIDAEHADKPFAVFTLEYGLVIFAESIFVKLIDDTTPVLGIFP